MNRTELIELANDFFKKNPIVTLVTVSEGYPSCRPVSEPFLHEGDVYLCTSASSRKMSHIKADPHVAMHGYDAKTQTFCTVRGLGAAVDDRATRERFWKEELSRYFPKGIDDPEYCFMKIAIRGVDYVDYSKGFDKPETHRESW